jgi:hypothetical protein
MSEVECGLCGCVLPENETLATWTRATRLDPPEVKEVACLLCAEPRDDGPDEGIVGDE